MQSEMQIKRKTVIQYLIGTFVLSYLSWGIIILANQYDQLKYGTPISMILYLIGGLSPTIIACIVLIRQKEVSGFKQICKECFKFKQKFIVYGAIIILSAIPFILPFMTGNVVASAPFYVIIPMIPMMIFGGGLEEVGWRYILQPSLERKFSFGIASAITGVIWILWHIPLFLIAGTAQNLFMSLPVFAIDVFGTAFVLAYLRKIGVGIWPCILFHSLHNALGGTYRVSDGELQSGVTAN